MTYTLADLIYNLRKIDREYEDASHDMQNPATIKMINNYLPRNLKIVRFNIEH